MLNFTDASLDPSVKKLASLLELPASRSWNCVDESSSLQLFHYNIEKTPDEGVEKIRGLVFDSEEEIVVARSYNYTPNCVLPQIELEEDGSLKLEDSDGKEHLLRDFSFCLGYEGTVMRVFKHGGKVYHSSHRRLDTFKSTWGNSPPFLSVYKQLGGPSDEELFNPSKNYSPYCHVFLMVHPKLLLSSLQPIGKGYLVYLGALDMYSSNPPYPEEECDLEKRSFPTITSFPENMEEETPFILSPQEISLEEANKHLREGWQGLGGEFIIVSSKESKRGEFPSLIKISSPDYEKRTEVRNHDPSLYHRYVELSSRAATMNKELFQSTYKCGENTTMFERYQLILEDFISYLPLHMRAECKDFADKLIKDRQELVSWMMELLYNGSGFLKEYKVPPRLYHIINNVKLPANWKNKPGAQTFVKKQLNYTLINEQGVSFYKMLRLMRTVKHRQAKK